MRQIDFGPSHSCTNRMLLYQQVKPSYQYLIKSSRELGVAADDLISGQSTFMVEMLEAKNAITNATKDSLILFDVKLVVEHLPMMGWHLTGQSLNIFIRVLVQQTLFSTHYHD